MDLREKKTRRSITNAFLQLRSKKPLERITVKELSELAEISKATFYLHYKDIYDLSDTLEKEVIQNVLNSIPHPEMMLTNSGQFVHDLFTAFHVQQSLIDILFSGSQSSVLPLSIEKELKQYIFQIYPELKENAQANILLSYQIQGGYYAYKENRESFGEDYVVEVISDVTKNYYQNL